MRRRWSPKKWCAINITPRCVSDFHLVPGHAVPDGHYNGMWISDLYYPLPAGVSVLKEETDSYCCINFLWRYLYDRRSQEITLINNGMTSDPEKFVTEIRIPIRPSDSL